jgi:thiamine pyrophosphokinase
LDFAIANNYKNVLILGINGREYEHSINNWSIFIKYSKRINLCTFTKNRYGFLVSESINLQAKENEIISIIPATQTIISSKGLKWELNKTELKIGNSEGARNQAIQQNIEINLYSGEYILFVDARLPYIFNFEN